MFEQDTFNYLLYNNNVTIKKLDNSRWNVTHDSLNNLQIDPNGIVLLDNKKVLIVHITGDFISLKVTVGPFTGYIRALKKSELKQLQLQLLKEWVVSIHSKLRDALLPPSGEEQEGQKR